MTWQELKNLKKANDGESGIMKATVEGKKGEPYDVNVIQGAIDVNELREAAEALEEGEEVYLKINFDRHPHPTSVKIGSWD